VYVQEMRFGPNCTTFAHVVYSPIKISKTLGFSLDSGTDDENFVKVNTNSIVKTS